MEILVLGVICGISIGALIWSVDRAHKTATESLKAQQIAHLEAADRVRVVIIEAMDRIQSRSLVEAVEIAALRAQNDATTGLLKDELRTKVNGAAVPNYTPRKMTATDGRTFDEHELEAL